ncbi:O-antigen ligase family protein [Acidithiobacillus sp. AC3]
MKRLMSFIAEDADDVLVYLIGLQMVFCYYTVAMSSISGGLAIAVFLLSSVRNRIVSVLGSKQIYPVLAILLWLPITLIWSRNIHSGLDELRNLWFYLLFVIGTTIFWDERRVRIIIVMFIVGAMSNFAIALLQMFGLWPLGGYDPIQGPVGYSYRVFLGVDTVPVILFMLWDMKYKFIFRSKIYPAMIALSLLIQLAITTGRTGQAIFAMLAIPFLFLVFNKQKKFLGVLVGALVIMVLILGFTVPTVELRWHDALRDVFLFFSGKPDTDLGLRMVFWDSAFHIFLSHPLFGIGPGSFIEYTIHLMEAGVIPAIPKGYYVMIEPHNSFLAYLTSYGLVGLSLFVFFLYSLLRRTWRQKNNALGMFQLLMLASFVVGSFSDVMIFRFAVVAPFMVSMSMSYRNR